METNGVNHNNKITKKYWTIREDEILMQQVQQQGPRNWRSIAVYLEGRTEKSCRLRWMNHLNPFLNKTPLEKHEEEKLFWLHKIYGNKWTMIARHFPGRTDNQLKNRYHNLMLSRHNQQISDISEDQNPRTTVSNGSTSTLRHLRGEIDLNYPPHSNLPMLRSSDQSGYGVENQMSYEFNAPRFPSLSRVGADQTETSIQGGQSDIQGSSNGLSMVSEPAPLPELDSVTCEELMDQQRKHVFIDFLGVNE